MVIISKDQDVKDIFSIKKLGLIDRIYSNFWVGMYGKLWVLAGDYLVDIVQRIIKLIHQKKSDYQRELKALSILDNI